MCGRFLMNEEAFEAVAQIAHIPDYIQPELFCKTIYPSNPSLVLTMENGVLTASADTFGFKSDYLKRLLINARAETITQKPMFRNAFSHSRCVVPCALFYEWDADKQKISFFSQNQPVLYMGGILIENCFIIITTAANGSMIDYHDRMPLLLNEDQIGSWLENPSTARQILKDVPQNVEHSFPVSQNRLF